MLNRIQITLICPKCKAKNERIFITKYVAKTIACFECGAVSTWALSMSTRQLGNQTSIFVTATQKILQLPEPFKPQLAGKFSGNVAQIGSAGL